SVYFREPPDSETVEWSLFETTSQTTSTVTGLTNGTVYEFMVAGIDDSGNETDGAETAGTGDDTASKVTSIPTSNLIQVSPNIVGGVFHQTYFDTRQVVLTVSTTVDDLLTADAETELFYTLDGSDIDTTSTTNDSVTGFVAFNDARVTEVEAERLFTVTIDFDPSDAAVDNISANTLRPSGGADHITLKYLVRRQDVDASRVFTDTYLIYNQAPDSFLKFSGTRLARGRPTLTVVESGNTDNDVIVIGGTSGWVPSSTTLDSGSRYRVQFEHFEEFISGTPTLSTTRAYHQATHLLNDDQILVTGGFNTDGRANPAAGFTLALNSTDLFDADAGSEGFTAATNMNNARSWHTSTRLSNGRILIIGGLNGQTEVLGTVAAPVIVVATPGDPDPTATLLTFDPAQAGLPAVLPALEGTVIEKLVGGVVTETGVISNSSPNDTDPSVQDLTIAGLVTENLVGDQFRLINGPTNTTERYDEDGTNPTATANMDVVRFGHTATLLQDGTVFVAGGAFDYGTDSEDPRSDGFNEFITEIYDPQDNTFTTLSIHAELSDTRVFHTATLLKDGKVLITGGAERGDYVFRTNSTSGGITIRRDAYVFDPFSRTVENVGNMNSNRALHSAVLLETGDVLIAGGQVEINADGEITISGTAELYHPDSQTFEAVGNLISPREALAMQLIPTDVDNAELAGKVL
ncbi:MAG: kelch repeat-containing protein, partial [Planctomycetota bacterium]